ncbi:long-chain fatty acid--CoA ligase [Solimonas sp. K1W22B-7]|uniref:class I adenylate-forming enzyme family protein n=1 Tax=Solimonas sp. K1W22B-7 TaxID=2303331 RepID=UPI000E333A06|nr:class I adenylate-forming enzyme family protein [Solimonas sp. K1W22B-7]AXQ30575.1 long-chain fatty acid--CoA ligase [Solimonas sp. K1W22B-7]
MSDTEKVQQIMRQISQAAPDFTVGGARVGDMEYPAYANAPASLRALCDRVFPQYGEAPFLVYQDERYSFAETHRLACRLARVLAEDYGVGPGRCVGIAMRNMPEWIVGFLAVQIAGGTVAALNSWWGARELEYGVKDCGAELVLVDPQRLDLLVPLLGPKLRAIVARSEGVLPPGVHSFEAATAAAPDDAAPPSAMGPDDLAIILYTSGTTGQPKGVALDNRAVVQQLWVWLHYTLASLQLVPPAPSIWPPAVLLTIPLFHVSGCNSVFLMSLLMGQKIVMMHRWSPSEALRLVEAERISTVAGVPTMAADLLNAPDREHYDLSSLKLFSGSGAATPPERIRELGAKMPSVAPNTGYGMTETCGAGTVIGGQDLQARPSSVGRALWPLVSLKLVDESGHDCGLAPGNRGEIWIRSVTNMYGYWNKPDATRETLQQGWIKTGDLGEFDAEGFLYIVGRIKEIIIRGGENISCNEVEAAIYEHPDVLEACVFGVHDDRLGEAVGVAVVPRPGRILLPQKLCEFLVGRLAPYKIPQHVAVRSEGLPRVATGKIDRLSLKRSSFASE